jgi:hypothetical protein
MIEEKQRVLNKRLVACKRAWRAGNRLALLDALDDCHQFGIPPLAWLVGALTGVVLAMPTAANSDKVHFLRWDIVCELRDRKEELAAAGYKTMFPKVYETASEALRGTIAEGRRDAVKKSYMRIQREMKGRRAARFFVSKFKPKA